MKPEWIWGYLFIAPIFIGIVGFHIGPIIYSFLMSFTRWDSVTQPVFIGLKNYLDLFIDQQVGHEFINMMYYTIGVVPLTIFLSLILANALNQKIRGVDFYRVVYFLPAVTMVSAITIVWQWLFNSQYGLIDKILGWCHLPQPVWLGDPKVIMLGIIIVAIWSGLGYNMVILLAGLQAIPQSIYESAEIDGAGRFSKFFWVTLPMLTPSLFFLLITSLISGFQAFDIIYMFIGGSTSLQGPLLEATRTMVYGIYEKGFTFLRMGYASAEAIVLFVLILIVTVCQFFLQKRWVHYDTL